MQPTALVGTLLFGDALPATGTVVATYRIGQWERRATPVPATPGADFQQAVLNALPHFAPKAKRVVYLFMSGGPSQLETFDYKPKLQTMLGQDLPDSVRKG